MNNLPRTLLVVEPHSVVGQALVTRFLDEGFGVWVLFQAEGSSDPRAARWTPADLNAKAFESVGGFRHVVFDAARQDESRLGEGGLDQQALDALLAESTSFLGLLRDVIKLQVFFEGGRLWTLESDDFFRSYFDLPITPVASGLRVSCFRSLCKEFARFRLQFNNLVYQPPVDAVPAADYRSALPHLKVFALKFKLPALDALVDSLAGQMELPGSAANGTVIQLGTGPNWNNY